jgi:hypothetical protein
MAVHTPTALCWAGCSFTILLLAAAWVCGGCVHVPTRVPVLVTALSLVFSLLVGVACLGVVAPSGPGSGAEPQCLAAAVSNLALAALLLPLACLMCGLRVLGSTCWFNLTAPKPPKGAGAVHEARPGQVEPPGARGQALRKPFLTSHTHPFHVDHLPAAVVERAYGAGAVAAGASIGMCAAPGRCKGRWARDLGLDLAVLAASSSGSGISGSGSGSPLVFAPSTVSTSGVPGPGPGDAASVSAAVVGERLGRSGGPVTLVTLMEARDLEYNGTPHLLSAARGVGLLTAHFPIRDKWIPGAHGPMVHALQQLHAQVAAGGRVVVHCNGGKGRTGLVVCLLLCTAPRTPFSPREAVTAVRAARPGTLPCAPRPQLPVQPPLALLAVTASPDSRSPLRTRRIASACSGTIRNPLQLLYLHNFMRVWANGSAATQNPAQDASV